MPFGRWENFDACKLDMKEQGHDEEGAQKICGAIEDRIAKGEIYKAVDDDLEVLSKSDDELVIGGYSTWDMVDPQNDRMSIAAQKAFLKRYFSYPQEYQAVTMDHGDFKAGVPLKKYVDASGKEYFSHVNEKGTYLITKCRNDGLKTTRLLREAVKKGEYGMYSISGLPLNSHIEKDSRVIDDVEPWAVTICRKGVVPKAKFQVISKLSKGEQDMSEQKTSHPIQENWTKVWSYRGFDLYQEPNGFVHVIGTGDVGSKISVYNFQPNKDASVEEYGKYIIDDAVSRWNTPKANQHLPPGEAYYAPGEEGPKYIPSLDNEQQAARQNWNEKHPNQTVQQPTYPYKEPETPQEPTQTNQPTQPPSKQQERQTETPTEPPQSAQPKQTLPSAENPPTPTATPTPQPSTQQPAAPQPPQVNPGVQSQSQSDRDAETWKWWLQQNTVKSASNLQIDAEMLLQKHGFGIRKSKTE